MHIHKSIYIYGVLKKPNLGYAKLSLGGETIKPTCKLSRSSHAAASPPDSCRLVPAETRSSPACVIVNIVRTFECNET